jgi:steroid delta-isomerase-like uncharacterized protein
MPAQDHKAIVRRCWEECFSGNLAVVDELVGVDYRWHAPGQEVSGREGIKQLIGAFRTGMPDMRWMVDDQVAEGDKVGTRWTARGTHTGELLGIAPTGRQATITGMVFSRLADGQIVEEWENFDQLGMLQQLGAIPTQS